MLKGKSESGASEQTASSQRGGFTGNLTRVTLAVVLALSLVSGWGTLAFADQSSTPAQKEATAETTDKNAETLPRQLRSGVDASDSDADLGGSEKKANNDLLLPTIIAIAGIVVLGVALVLLLVVWRRSRKKRK
jgi:hypothetical protein